MAFKIKEDYSTKYLQSEIILYCLKKCIHGPHLSPATKDKVLSLMCEFDESVEETTVKSDLTTFSTNSRTMRSESTTLGSDSKQEFNFLGIDEDILQESPEKLTSEQEAELRDCILEQLTILHKFCTSVNSKVKIPDVKGDIDDFLCDLEENIMEQTLQLQKFIDLQKNISDAKMKNGTTLNLIIDGEIEKLKRMKHNGWYVRFFLFYKVKA